MTSLEQESGQSSPASSMQEIDLENGCDSSPVSDESSPSSPLEVSSDPGSDSGGEPSSDDSSGSRGLELVNEDESKAFDSSASSDKEAICVKPNEDNPKASDSSSSSGNKKVDKAVCLRKRLKGNCVDHASKKVYFTEDQCRWTMIKHPASVKKVRNFVQTANNAYVDVAFEGKVMDVVISLGDDPEEKLRISMKASSEQNCVTVAEEYQAPRYPSTVQTEDLDNIGSYDSCSAGYPPNGCFTTPDYKLDLQRTRESDGVVEFETNGESKLYFEFVENDGKGTVNINFRYGDNEAHELGFDFEVSGRDLSELNLPSALTTTTTNTSLGLSLNFAPTVLGGEVEEKDESDNLLEQLTFRLPLNHKSPTTTTTTTTTSSTSTITGSTSTTTTRSTNSTKTTGGSVKAKEKRT